MALPVPVLIVVALLLTSATLIVDYLVHQWLARRARRRRLEARIVELKRLAERPTLNTRGRAP